MPQKFFFLILKIVRTSKGIQQRSITQIQHAFLYTDNEKSEKKIRKRIWLCILIISKYLDDALICIVL